MSDEVPTAKFEVGERVKAPGAIKIVQSRNWTGIMWVYLCVPENSKSDSPALQFPEIMLNKPDPPAEGKAIFSGRRG